MVHWSTQVISSNVTHSAQQEVDWKLRIKLGCISWLKASVLQVKMTDADEQLKTIQQKYIRISYTVFRTCRFLHVVYKWRDLLWDSTWIAWHWVIQIMTFLCSSSLANAEILEQNIFCCFAVLVHIQTALLLHKKTILEVENDQGWHSGPLCSALCMSADTFNAIISAIIIFCIYFHLMISGSIHLVCPTSPPLNNSESNVFQSTSPFLISLCNFANWVNFAGA